MLCKYCNGPTKESHVATADLFHCPKCNMTFSKPAVNFKGLQIWKEKDVSNVTKKKKSKTTIKQAKPKPPRLQDLTIGTLFNKLSETFPGYTAREAQLGMAAYVKNIIGTKSVLLAEAGVGTGKSFAYLIPLLQKHLQAHNHFGPFVISTKTKNLQEQLVMKDIPIITELYRFICGRETEIILSKGRRNYACLATFDDMKKTKIITPVQYDQLRYWYNKSEWGDMEEKGAPHLGDAITEKISADNCRADCNLDCKYRNMKNRRQMTQGIIVTNHNQLVSHLKMIADGREKKLWLNPSYLVIDEAHNFEDVARDALSNRIEFSKLHGLLKRVISRYSHIDAALTGRKILRDIERELKTQASSVDEDEKQNITISKELSDNIGDLAQLLGEVEFSLDLASSQKRRTNNIDEILLNSIGNAKKTVTDLYQHLADSNSILWVEGSKSVSLVQAPFDIGPFLEKTLWRHHPNLPVILASATLSVNGDFGGVIKRLGIKSRNTKECSYPSPFDYEKNLKIYVPKDMPYPAPAAEGEETDAFTQEAAVRIGELVTISEGRALVLFTSHRRMEYVYQYVQNLNLPYTLLKQGDGKGPNEILEIFKADKSSILFATGAFWEGTDVSGEALSLLIIDKLPFPTPSDPIIARMTENAKREGLNPFDVVTLPEMLTVLKQGSGRLIRRETDAGVIALLDSRAWKPRYHEAVVKAMPPGLWVDKLINR